MQEAERLDRWLHQLHRRRIDEERPAISAFAPLFNRRFDDQMPGPAS
jgi:hypothetical protein